MLRFDDSLGYRFTVIIHNFYFDIVGGDGQVP
ncbi:hypothetical protein EMEDMD4_570225 [Sinorhizobium medicae]|uniref:Uncharacterized protein n=1 Tax=Sinorhizobium medicae TaxID=110321 RepID=A0A508X939_9HYPH|nr:hypothetical protein EMEDMD4_570225 [Sinorhizobium medicae]